MTTRWQSAAVASALIGLSVAMPSASAQDAGNGYGPPPYADNGYGPPPGYSSGYANAPECNAANYGPGQAMPPTCLPQAYCDQYGCPDDFYDMPIWYGPVFYGNAWFAGPVYYRVWHGQRQYWIHGGWHYDAWHGPLPSWWNAGHYHTGPALGRNYYRNHGVGTAATGVRVWRGTQASTYNDNGSGQYYRRAFANRETVPPAGERPIRGVGFNTQHVPQQRAPQYHYSASHISVTAGSHSFKGSARSGYRGGRR